MYIEKDEEKMQYFCQKRCTCLALGVLLSAVGVGFTAYLASAQWDEINVENTEKAFMKAGIAAVGTIALEAVVLVVVLFASGTLKLRKSPQKSASGLTMHALVERGACYGSMDDESSTQAVQGIVGL